MKISLIVACGPSGEIGRQGKLPWPYLRPDMTRFVNQTRNKPVIMGSKTWDSLPNKPLWGRYNIVMTHDTDGFAEKILACDQSARASVDSATSIDDALLLAKTFIEQARPDEPPLDYEDEVIVMGGAQIYALFLPIADRIYLTKVEIPGTNDAEFPECDRRIEYPFSALAWDERYVGQKYHVVHGYRLGFFTFVRKTETEAKAKAAKLLHQNSPK